MSLSEDYVIHEMILNYSTYFQEHLFPQAPSHLHAASMPPRHGAAAEISRGAAQHGRGWLRGAARALAVAAAAGRR